MSGVSVQVDDRQVQAALARLAARVRDLEPVFASMGQVVVTRADLSFRGEQSPAGDAWAALSAVTLRRRRGSTAQILSDTGRLANSITAHASAQAVRVGTNVAYAAVQQFGNPANRMYNTAGGHAAPIPARPFLPTDGLPAADQADMLDILRQALRAAAS